MKNASELAKAVEGSPELERQMRSDPAGTLKTLGAMPLQNDAWIYRGVILALGFAVCATVLTGGVLAFYGKPIPEGLMTLAATAVGAMAGLLAPAPGR